MQLNPVEGIDGEFFERRLGRDFLDGKLLGFGNNFDNPLQDVVRHAFQHRKVRGAVH